MNAKHNVCYVNKFPFIAQTLDIDMIRLPLLEFCIILATKLGQWIKFTMSLMNLVGTLISVCGRAYSIQYWELVLDLWKVNLTSQCYIYGSRHESTIISA